MYLRELTGRTQAVKHRIIGCDVGGTAIKAGLLGAGAGIVRRDEMSTCCDSGRERFVNRLCDLVASLSPGHAVDAVGLGIAGILDTGRTTVLESPNMPLLDGLALKPILEQKLRCPVVIENDANAAALGELRAGAGRGHSQFLFFTLGTGIGSGLILNERLWLGEMGKAGEFGHVTVFPEGELCGCGKRGCLEAHASGTAIIKMACDSAMHDEQSSLRCYRDCIAGITPEVVYHHACEGDAASRMVFQAMARALAIAMAGVNHLLDIHTFIVGGGVSGAYDLFCPMVMDELNRRVFKLSRGRVRLIRAQLGNDAGMYGAAFAARDALLGSNA